MNIEILNWMGPPWKVDWGGVKRTRRDEPVLIHMCMETTQGNSLCSYHYVKLSKMPCFSFLSFMFFLLQKSENRRVEQVLVGGALVGVESRQGKAIGG
jgi:hypothetical protein